MSAVDNSTPSKSNPSMSDKPWGVDVSTNKNRTFTLQAIFNLFKGNLDGFYQAAGTGFSKAQADAVYPQKTDVYTKAETDALRNAAFMGGATPATVPNESLGPQQWKATLSGTYPYMGGLVVDLTLGVTDLVFDGATWRISVAPVDVTGKLSVSDFLESQRIDNGRLGSYDGDHYVIKGCYLNNSGALTVNASFKMTGYIPATQADILVASNLIYSNASVPSVVFFNASKVFISFLSVAGSSNPLTLASGNIPVGTAFIVFNSALASVPTIIINGFATVDSRMDTFDQKFIDQTLKNSFVSGDYYTYPGKYCRGTDGTLVSLATTKTTEFIPFVDGDVLTAKSTNPSSATIPNILFYDSSKAFISYLTFNSLTDPITVNAANTPSNCAYIRLNSLVAKTDTWVSINSFKGVVSEIDSLKVVDQQQAVINRDITGDKFNLSGYVNNTTGAFVSSGSFRVTDFIPAVQSDVFHAYNTSKAGSYDNVNFYDANFAFISALDFATNINPIRLYSVNIPVNTAYIRLNAVPSLPAFFIKNGDKDLKIVSDNFTPCFFYGKRWTSFGDSITAAGTWQTQVDFCMGTIKSVRGVGGSSVSLNSTGVAIKPDGDYIDRRSNYASDADFETALGNLGYTNNVTTPTWHDYAVSPSSYTLPAGSYFLISSQGSSQDRVDTIPLNTQVLSILFGTNDAFGGLGSNIGTVDDLGGSSFLGNYKLMLDRIHTRIPDVKIILCVPAKCTAEASGFARTATGIGFDNIREGIRNLGRTYGYEVIDFSNVINFKNLNKLADGVHPTETGYFMMGNYFAQKVMSINYRF